MKSTSAAEPRVGQTLRWTPALSYKRFSLELGCLGNFFLHKTFLSRQPAITRFNVDAIDRLFDDFYEDCQEWLYDTERRARLYQEVLHWFHTFIDGTIKALGLNEAKIMKKSLLTEFYRDAKNMFGVDEQDIIDGKPKVLGTGRTPNQPMHLMRYWLDKGSSPFSNKGNWFKNLRHSEAHGGTTNAAMKLMGSLCDEHSYLAALMRLALEMKDACEEEAIRVEDAVSEEIMDNVLNVAEPMNATELSNFDRKKTDPFPPADLVNTETVKAAYLEIDLLDPRYSKSRVFNPAYMAVSSQLMAYLKMLILEDYGGFEYAGNAPDEDRFPQEFFREILVSAVTRVPVDNSPDKLYITFRGHTLRDATYDVTSQFGRIWRDPDGLGSATLQSTLQGIIEDRGDTLDRKREIAQRAPEVLVEGAFVKGVDSFPSIRPRSTNNNTMTYVIVGGCLFAAIYLLNR